MKTLVAPESVVTEAAAGLAESGAQTLAGASLDELADVNETVRELDRILEQNPDAVNTEQLKALRDTLNNTKPANTGRDQRVGEKKLAKPRRHTDTPLPRRKGDNLRVLPPGEIASPRRTTGRPDTIPDGSSLKPDPRPVHAMSLQPVRLNQ